MKIKHLLLSVLAVASVAVSCKKDNGQNDKPYVSVKPAEITFEVGELEPKVVTVSSNRDWQIEDVKEAWLGVKKLSDTEAQVSANEANTGKDRTATVTFRVAGQKATLTVTQKGEGGSAEPVVEGDGSKEKPYNVAQATAVAKALAADAYTETAVYVKGTVVSLKDPETTISKYGSITLYISDDGKEDGQLYIYGLKDVDGAKFTAADKFSAGDVVVLYGKLQNYKGNTPEMATGGQLVSVNGKEPEAPVLEEVTGTGVVVAVSKAGFLVSTTDGIKYVFDSKVVPTVKVGDNVTVKGSEDTYNGVTEIVNYSVSVNSENNTFDVPKPVEITADNIATYSDLFSYVKTSGNLTINGNYYNVELQGASTKASLSFATGVDASLDGKNVDIEGYFVGFSGSNNAYFNIMYTKIAASAVQPEPEPEDPIIEGGISVSVDKAFLAANKAGKMDDVISYANSSDYGSNNVTELRIYKGQTLTITAKSGYTIYSVKFTCTKGNNEKHGFYTDAPVTVDAGATTESTGKGNDGTITVTGNTTKVVYTANTEQMRVTKMTVVYKKVE